MAVERHSLCRCRVADYGDELWITPGVELPIGAVTVTTLWARVPHGLSRHPMASRPAPQARSAEERKRRGSTARSPVCGPQGTQRVGGTLTSARPQCRRRRPRRGHRRWRRLLHREWRSTHGLVPSSGRPYRSPDRVMTLIWIGSHGKVSGRRDRVLQRLRSSLTLLVGGSSGPRRAMTSVVRLWWGPRSVSPRHRQRRPARIRLGPPPTPPLSWYGR
jgi:hypothetical protein